MKSKQIFLFATNEDLIELSKFIESHFNIHYAEAGLLNTKVSCISSIQTAIEVNHIEYGDWNFNKMYMILPKEKDLQIREIPQRGGGVKYSIDQMKNEESVVIFLGGKYKGAIVASKIGTISQAEFAKNFMKILSVYFKKNFTNIKGFYVSSRALEEAKKGLRLTTNLNNTIEHDLNIGLK